MDDEAKVVETRSRAAVAAPCRRCVVTGAVAPRSTLVRFVVGPDGVLVPDLRETLPGRGLWLSARRDIVEAAATGKQVARAARRAVIAPDDLVGLVERLLVQSCLELIGLARRAGEAVAGFEKVRQWLRARRCELLLAASDGAVDGRARLRALVPEATVVDLFSSAELAAAFGRENVVHAVIAPGGLALRLRREAARLQGFRCEPDAGPIQRGKRAGNRVAGLT